MSNETNTVSDSDPVEETGGTTLRHDRCQTCGGRRSPAPAARKKVERRRHIDPTTCERDYGGDELEFMKAMDEYKRLSGRQFPTWSEVLEVIRSLGYRKVAKPEPIKLSAKK